MFAPLSPAQLAVLSADLELVLSRTRTCWEEMRGGRLFLTGGTGFFGCWLLASFLHANQSLGLGAEAVVLTRDPERFRQCRPELAEDPAIHLHQGDVADFEFPPGNFTHVIHAASELSLAQPRDPLGMLETTLKGCRRVLRLAGERGVRKLLFTSSGAVYGPMRAGRAAVAEDEPVSQLPLQPRGAYAEAKRMAELACVLGGREVGVEVKIARGFAFLGPYLPANSHLAAAAFMQAALRGDGIVIEGHGQTVRSYLYGADLAVWLWTILFKGCADRPYNTGSDLPVTIAELADAIAAACSPSPAVRVLGRIAEGEIADVYLPDIRRARDELGLGVITPFAEGIRRTLQWFR